MIVMLLLSTVMVTLTVMIHFAGLMLLLHVLRRRGHTFKPLESTMGQMALFIAAVLGIFAIHALEIWLYAFVYLLLGLVEDFETALYFSTTTFTTVGYGDVVLPKDWRIFGVIEAANGFILFGWSIAFLMSLMGKFRTLEHDWLEHDRLQD